MESSNEFAAEEVAESQLVAWPRVAAVAAMVGFSLPTFVTGLEVAHGLPGSSALYAFVVGSVIIFGVGAVMGSIGARTRLSSYLLVRIAFGDSGARLVNIAFAISLLGWFGVNINLFSEAVGRLSQSLFAIEVPELGLALLASACMTVTTLVGFRAINVLSTLLIPVLVVVTVMLAESALGAMPLSEILAIEKERSLSTGDGVSAIVGAIIIGAIILPDITRFSRHWHGAVYTAFFAYIIVQMFVMSAAALAGAVSGETDILQILLDVNLGIGAFVIVIAGSWVLNSLNLYSAVLSVKASFPELNAKTVTLALGAVGVGAALMNILDSFLTFLFYLSVVFIPVAGVIIVDYLLVRSESYSVVSLNSNRAWNLNGIVAWAVGALFSVLVSESVLPPLTTVAAIDAVLLSAGLYLVLSWRARRLQRGGVL